LWLKRYSTIASKKITNPSYIVMLGFNWCALKQKIWFYTVNQS
jgi:hypothetical protein